MGAIDVWAQITTERMLKRPWMQTLLRWTGRSESALETVETTLRAMDEGNVDIALLSAWHGPEGCLISNEEVSTNGCGGSDPVPRLGERRSGKTDGSRA